MGTHCKIAQIDIITEQLYWMILQVRCVTCALSSHLTEPQNNILNRTMFTDITFKIEVLNITVTHQH